MWIEELAAFWAEWGGVIKGSFLIELSIIGLVVLYRRGTLRDIIALIRKMAGDD